MNKQIVVKLASITAAVALLAGATFAAFTSNSATLTNVNLASANPQLQIWDGDSWETTANLGISETNMYPGWEGSVRTFYLKNATGGSVPFGSIFAALVSGAIGNWNELKDVVELRFGETGTDWSTDWYNLQQWYDGTAGPDSLLLSPLNDGEQRLFSLQFGMSPDAGDAAKDKNLTFTLSFVGETP